MRIRVITAVLLVTMMFVAGSTCVDAQAAGPLKVLASNGFRAVLDDLTPRCEKAAGRSISIQSGTSTSLLQRVNSGEMFDVAVMTTEAIDDLVKAGKVTAATRTALGRSGIGIGVRSGAAKPDITTADSVKHALVGAKSVSYAGDGASRPHIESMFEALGITKAMASKTVLEQGSVRAAAKVASGEAELLITLVSEILPAPGLELIGPLPDRFQHYVSFAAAAGTSAARGGAAKSLISCLSAPEVAGTLKKRGMEVK